MSKPIELNFNIEDTNNLCNSSNLSDANKKDVAIKQKGKQCEIKITDTTYTQTQKCNLLETIKKIKYNCTDKKGCYILDCDRIPQTMNVEKLINIYALLK